MIDIDALELLAKAAQWTGDWNASCGTVDCSYPADSKFAGEFDEIAHPVPVGVSDYIAAAQPKVALALIAEVRALREDALMLGFELLGVITDVEQGPGFDATCLATIRRVSKKLGDIERGAK